VIILLVHNLSKKAFQVAEVILFYSCFHDEVFFETKSYLVCDVTGLKRHTRDLHQPRAGPERCQQPQPDDSHSTSDIEQVQQPLQQRSRSPEIYENLDAPEEMFEENQAMFLEIMFAAENAGIVDDGKASSNNLANFADSGDDKEDSDNGRSRMDFADSGDDKEDSDNGRSSMDDSDPESDAFEQDDETSSDDETSNWHPFVSKEEFDIYMTFLKLNLSEGQGDYLLAMLKDNKFPNLNVKCSKSFLRRIELALPELDIKEFEVTARLERKQTGSNEIITYEVSKTVGYISIIGILRQLMATPKERGRLQTESEEVGDDDLVLNFNQTPLFQQLRRYKNLVDFRKDNELYSIGDIVQVTSGQIVRIEALFYKKTDVIDPCGPNLALLAKLPTLHFKGKGNCVR
jgi:hypothetical protein